MIWIWLYGSQAAVKKLTVDETKLIFFNIFVWKLTIDFELRQDIFVFMSKPFTTRCGSWKEVNKYSV